MLQQVLDDLQGAGLRATVPRVKVLEFFRTAGFRHCSAEDVFRHLVEAKVDIALATVYRALAQLVEAGILTSGVIDSSKVVYELNEGKHHDHIVCVNCGKIGEFSDPLIDAREKVISEGLGYLLTGHQLVLHGYCPECRPAPPGSKAGRKR